jgi:hypothetical protein
MTLTLGDKIYHSAPWVPQIANYPRTRLADYLIGVLEQMYMHSQHSARYLGSTCYGFNLRDITSDYNAIARAFFTTTETGIHRGRVTVPRQTSHVTAHVLYSIPSEDPVRAHLKARVINGANEDSASLTIDRQYTIPEVPHIGHLNGEAGVRSDYPFTSRHAVYLDSVSAELLGGAGHIDPLTPGRCQILVNGHATNLAVNSARGFQPLFVAVYAEMRY